MAQPTFAFSKTPRESKGSAEDAFSIELSRTGTEPDALLEVEPSILSWVSDLFKPKGYRRLASHHLRKVPTKVEPKVFFANERTFLAWLHMSVTLSSISVAIVAFAEANAFSQIYGLMLMPVAIAFCCYSLFMYMKRSSMIRQRHPGPCKISNQTKSIDKLLLVCINFLSLFLIVNFLFSIEQMKTKLDQLF
jgi:uncharacterized membrane protein YidH (DUF202 family)